MRKIPRSLLFVSLASGLAPLPSFSADAPKDNCSATSRLFSFFGGKKSSSETPSEMLAEMRASHVMHDSYPWPKSLEFVIPEAQKAEALKQVDKEYLHTSYFVIPNNDGEAKRANEILQAAQAPHVKTSHQAWGAVLEKEGGLPSPAQLKSEGIKRLVVFEMPGEKVEEAYRKAGIDVVIVDHHVYKDLNRYQSESSLEQLMKLVNWPASKTDHALAVNDRSYIPGLKAQGLSPEEISAVRRYDLMAQGNPAASVDADVRDARAMIPSLEKHNGIYFVRDVGSLEAALKQELAIGTPDGLVSTFTVNSGKVGFSGNPKIAEMLLKYDFAKQGYAPKSFAQYGGGDKNASMFFGFKPTHPPAGSHELLPAHVEAAIKADMDRVLKGEDPLHVAANPTVGKPTPGNSFMSRMNAANPHENGSHRAFPAAAHANAEVNKSVTSTVSSALDASAVPADVKAAGMLPRGSALATGAGDLEKQGIRQIIHAATGAMGKSGGNFEPTLQSIEDSVKNSLALARANGHKRVAMPFLGGAIFVKRIGIAPDALAEAIVNKSLAESHGLEIRFVTFGDQDTSLFQRALAKAKAKYPGVNAEVDSGSITDGKLHGATAIVNAANMEVTFGGDLTGGGGLSGAIGRTTGKWDEINAEAQKGIKEFYAHAAATANNGTKP